jgi:hypothetical protein
MTDLEQRAMRLLPRIRYAPGIWHEPRGKWLFRLWERDPRWKLTAQEHADLWFLIWHYRRQLDDAQVIGYANEVNNGQVALRF